MRVSLLAALFVVLGFTSNVQAVPVQWLAALGGNNHYYDWVPGRSTWQQARISANGMFHLGQIGQLATVTSAAEGSFITDSVRNDFGWLGAFQDTLAPDYSEPAGGWRWVTGEPWSYTNWAGGQPDNFGGAQNFIRTLGAPWDDLDNNASGSVELSGYYIEYVPEPSSWVLLGVLSLGFGLFARWRRR